MLTLLRYTRDAERRADGHAVRILRASGVSALGLIQFFEYVKDKHGSDTDEDGGGGDIENLFSTHPGVEERIDALRQVGEWPSTPALSETEWQALNAICSALPAAETSDGD